MISQRTKVALQAAKARGEKLGSPTPHHGSAVGVQVLKDKAKQFRQTIRPIIEGYKLKVSRAIALLPKL